MSDDSDVYSDWAEYHKKTEAKLDSVLAKCYECIEKKSGYQEHTVCSEFTGLNTLTPYGVLNAGTSFLNGAATAYNPAFGYAQVNTYNYGGKSNNPFSQSISCMVGVSSVLALFAVGPVPMPCEYGKSYCSITIQNTDNIYHYSCAAVCQPSELQICSTGTLSNKISPICFSGSLISGSSAPAILCDIGAFCYLDPGSNSAGCSLASTDCTAVICSFSDYSNKVGPMCWVGVFDKNAVLNSCGGTTANPVSIDLCIVYTSTVDGSVNGACSPAGTVPPGATLITKSTVDFGNKLGPICFVGQFEDNAQATACSLGKVCQRETIQTDVGTTITIGSCSAKCYPSRTTFCCSTDLCNTYHSEVNYEVREQPQSDEKPKSSYTAPIYSSYQSYNKQMY